MADPETAWFAHRNYGIGAGMPIRWQGWALIVAHLALTMVGLPWAKTNFGGFATYVGIIMLIALPIYAAKTEGGWKWRWGRN